MSKEDLQRRAVVDEYGALSEELTPWKAKLARHAELAKIIRGWYAEADAEAAFVARGDRYQASLSPKELESRIDIDAAWSALGKAKFLRACAITLKGLKEQATPAVFATLVQKFRTGTRSLQVHPVIPPAAETDWRKLHIVPKKLAA